MGLPSVVRFQVSGYRFQALTLGCLPSICAAVIYGVAVSLPVSSGHADTAYLIPEA
jgi:hypothetical protein